MLSSAPSFFARSAAWRTASFAVSEPSVPTAIRANIQPPLSASLCAGCGPMAAGSPLLALGARAAERRHHNRLHAAPADAGVLDRHAGGDRHLRPDLSRDRDRQALGHYCQAT